MAWLKVSFPAESKVTEALVPVRVLRLAASGVAERGTAVFFAEAFLAFGFFIESPVDGPRPEPVRALLYTTKHSGVPI